MSRHSTSRTRARQLLDMGWQQACESYHPESLKDPAAARVAGIGLLMARALDNPKDVLNAAAEALEDMNFHNEAATLREMAGADPQVRVPNHIDVYV